MSTEARGDEGTRLFRGVRWATAVLLICAAAFLGTSLVTCAYHVAAGGDDDAGGTVTVVRPTPDVIVAVRDLARLESAQYEVQRVIDLRDRQQRLFGLIEAQDAILLVASGEVTAGVDLTGLQDGDVVVDPEAGTARITLPAPEILSTRLDNDRTYVHTRETDALAKRSETLETRARQEAERTIRDSAIEGGILDRAARNAEQTVRVLVRSLGYDHVQVDSRSE